jgi:hypothetical protein
VSVAEMGRLPACQLAELLQLPLVVPIQLWTAALQGCVTESAAPTAAERTIHVLLRAMLFLPGAKCDSGL